MDEDTALRQYRLSPLNYKISDIAKQLAEYLQATIVVSDSPKDRPLGVLIAGYSPKPAPGRNRTNHDSECWLIEVDDQNKVQSPKPLFSHVNAGIHAFAQSEPISRCSKGLIPSWMASWQASLVMMLRVTKS